MGHVSDWIETIKQVHLKKKPMRTISIRISEEEHDMLVALTVPFGMTKSGIAEQITRLSIQDVHAIMYPSDAEDKQNDK